MLRLDVIRFEESFQSNLKDWCEGGPKEGGWTREGEPHPLFKAWHLLSARRGQISVDDGLAKNRTEVEKWHISFLKNHERLESTAYYSEYLRTRCDERSASLRVASFLEVFRSMRAGYDIKHPVLVADVEPLNLGFRYFRFDGCHRLACAAVLGMESVPAWIFTLGQKTESV